MSDNESVEFLGYNPLIHDKPSYYEDDSFDEFRKSDLEDDRTEESSEEFFSDNDYQNNYQLEEKFDRKVFHQKLNNSGSNYKEVLLSNNHTLDFTLIKPIHTMDVVNIFNATNVHTVILRDINLNKFSELGNVNFIANLIVLIQRGVIKKIDLTNCNFSGSEMNRLIRSLENYYKLKSLKLTGNFISQDLINRLINFVTNPAREGILQEVEIKYSKYSYVCLDKLHEINANL